MRSDWLFPICAGGERLQGRQRPQGASDAEAGGAAPSHHPRLEPSGRRGARPVLRLGHHGSGRQAARAATSSASSASRLCRRRGGAARSGRRRFDNGLAASRPSGKRGRSPHSVRRAGRARADLARHRAVRRRRARHEAQGAGRWLALPAAARRARSTRSARMCRARRLQWLDLLALSRRRHAQADRRFARGGAAGARRRRPEPGPRHSSACASDFPHHGRQRGAVQVAQHAPSGNAPVRRPR